MTKQLLLFTFILCTKASVFAQSSSTTTKAEMKKVFYTSCLANTGVAEDNAAYPLMEEYCECAADKVINKFSVKEITAFEKWSQKKLKKKLMPVIQSCLDELERELENK